jgi:hypothetical protein
MLYHLLTLISCDCEWAMVALIRIHASDRTCRKVSSKISSRKWHGDWGKSSKPQESPAGTRTQYLTNTRYKNSARILKYKIKDIISMPERCYLLKFGQGTNYTTSDRTSLHHSEDGNYMNTRKSVIQLTRTRCTRPQTGFILHSAAVKA